MTVFHDIRDDALTAGVLLIARRQVAAATLEEADGTCRSFNLDEMLDAWQPEWRKNPPPAQMGPMSLRLQALSYCVFVGVWQEDVGFMLHHPDAFPPKSVTLTFTHKEPVDAPRAHLALGGGNSRALVPFPPIGPALLAPARSLPFAESREALTILIKRMVHRVNLVAPAVLLMDDEA